MCNIVCMCAPASWPWIDIAYVHMHIPVYTCVSHVSRQTLGYELYLVYCPCDYACMSYIYIYIYYLYACMYVCFLVALRVNVCLHCMDVFVTYKPVCMYVCIYLGRQPGR